MSHSSRPDAPGTASSAELLRGRLMQRALKALLDAVPGARAAMPHLAALEAALGQRGVSAIGRASLRSLEKIHTQMRVLPIDPSDGTMLDLLSLVQGALRGGSHAGHTRQLSPFDPMSTVVIAEASHSEFMKAMRETARET